MPAKHRPIENLAALVFLALFAVSSIAPNCLAAQPTSQAPKVTIAAAYSENITREATFIGRGEAAAKTDLVARVDGIVTEIVAADGASVNEGDVIIRIEPDSYEAEVAAQKAAVLRAEANLELARIELARKTELLRRQAAPASEVDIAKAKHLMNENLLAY